MTAHRPIPYGIDVVALPVGEEGGGRIVTQGRMDVDRLGSGMSTLRRR